MQSSEPCSLSAPLERKFALVVGVNGAADRASILAQLKYAENDATALAAALVRPACGFTLPVPALLGASARANEIKRALHTLLLQSTSQDALLFFFSGHALPVRLADGSVDIFLVTHDFDPALAAREAALAISLRWLWQYLYAAPDAGNILIVLDCCYAGNFASAAADRLNIDMRGLLHMVQDDINITNETWRSRSRIVLTATGYNQEAYERDMHGRMSGLLIAALHGEVAAVRDQRGRVSIQRLHEYLQDQLPEQLPYLLSNLTSPYILADYGPIMAAERHERDADEREQRLQALISDPGSFLHDRLKCFVGRVDDLAILLRRIVAMQRIGGYVAISGPAGQGKSSLMARLIQEFDPTQVAYQIVPLNPGPDYQVALLRSIMARLILKYDLSETYVASVSRPALREALLKVVQEVALRGGHEVIFIDGLDQLADDDNGARDLSFLPLHLSAGIVFVISLRPDDTLKSLELFNACDIYALPDLSRADFARMLARGGVQLSDLLIEQCYAAMQQNALYLDLAVRELATGGVAQITQLLQRVAANPDHIFSLAIDRLRGRHRQWRAVIKPILGALLVARAPLSVRALRALIGAADDAVRDGIAQLGGLLAQDSAYRYALYHTKLRDYLRQDQQPMRAYVFAMDEEEGWHQKLAGWCAGSSLNVIWQDIASDAGEQERRSYARQQYIAHLFAARSWDQLWAVLDAGEYGRGKLRHAPSASGYVLDLDFGRRAAAQLAGEAAISIVPRLWRYSMLRARLSRQADTCPDALLEALVLVGRRQEAIGLADLLADADRQQSALLAIGLRIAQQPGQADQGRRLLVRAGAGAQALPSGAGRDQALARVALALGQLGEEAHARALAALIAGQYQRAETLRYLASALAHAGAWESADACVRVIDDPAVRVPALGALALGRARAGDQRAAQVLLAEATACARAIPQPEERATALIAAIDIARTLADTADAPNDLTTTILRDAVDAAHTIADTQLRAETWGAIAIAAHAIKLLDESQQYFEQALQTAGELADQWMRDSTVCVLAQFLAQAEQWPGAIAAAHSIADPCQRDQALAQVAAASALADRLDIAQPTAHAISGQVRRLEALMAVLQAKSRHDSAIVDELLFEEALAVAQAIEYTQQRYFALVSLTWMLGQIGDWARATQVARLIDHVEHRKEALALVAVAQAQAGHLSAAMVLIDEALHIHEQEDALARTQAICVIVHALARAARLDVARARLAELAAETRAICDARVRSAALLLIARSFLQIGQAAPAGALLSEISIDARGLRDPWQRAAALGMLAVELAHAGEDVPSAALLDEAIAAARGIEDYEQRTAALRRCADVLIQLARIPAALELIEEAFATTNAILSIGRKMIAQAVLAGLYAQVGYRVNAQALLHEMRARVHQIAVAWERAQALMAIAQAYVHAQDWERALETVGEIAEYERREAALGSLAIALAHAGAWDLSIKTIDTFRDPGQQARARSGVAWALAQAGQTHQANRLLGDAAAVVAAIPQAGQRIPALVLIAHTLGAAGDHARLLSLIQAHWHQADTIAILLLLLPMAAELVVHAPDIGSALITAFDWLNRYSWRLDVAAP